MCGKALGQRLYRQSFTWPPIVAPPYRKPCIPCRMRLNSSHLQPEPTLANSFPCNPSPRYLTHGGSCKHACDEESRAGQRGEVAAIADKTRDLQADRTAQHLSPSARRCRNSDTLTSSLFPLCLRHKFFFFPNKKRSWGVLAKKGCLEQIGGWSAF